MKVFNPKKKFNCTEFHQVEDCDKLELILTKPEWEILFIRTEELSDSGHFRNVFHELFEVSLFTINAFY